MSCGRSAPSTVYSAHKHLASICMQPSSATHTTNSDKATAANAYAALDSVVSSLAMQLEAVCGQHGCRVSAGADWQPGSNPGLPSCPACSGRRCAGQWSLCLRICMCLLPSDLCFHLGLLAFGQPAGCHAACRMAELLGVSSHFMAHFACLEDSQVNVGQLITSEALGVHESHSLSCRLQSIQRRWQSCCWPPTTAMQRQLTAA